MTSSTGASSRVVLAQGDVVQKEQLSPVGPSLPTATSAFDGEFWRRSELVVLTPNFVEIDTRSGRCSEQIY
jgi:hypothetical protein